MSINTAASRERSPAVVANRAVYWLSRHWLFVISVIFGVYVGLPWLAPIFMKLGWTGAGNLIYQIYATQCHQLPQRSFFLFGPKATYSLAEIQTAWVNTSNPAILRQFSGNEAMGWKVAWSDRMVSMYTAILPVGWVFRLLRGRLKPLSVWGFAAFSLPLVIDGATHMLSDLGGIGNGFRDSNAWLAALTGDVFPAAFYAGDALGSLNSWARVVTGILFAIGCVWLAYPYLAQALGEAAAEVEEKFNRAGLAL